MLRTSASTFAAFALLLAPPSFGQEMPQDPGLEGDDVFIKSRPFSIPNKQSARALYDAARQHVEAGRWTEAVTTIERLIEEHSGSVIELGADSPVLARSIQPVYRGAADAARELFARLPAQARAAYSDRYAARAEQLLERASAALDTTALADVARRYPLTAAARSAWLTLGDLEAEAGNIEAARAAWKRAAEALPDEAAPSGLALRDRWTPGDSAMPAAFLSLANTDSDSVEIPAGEAHGWEKPLRIDESQTSPFRQDSFNSFPIQAGDSVLASNSLTLSCVDALSGSLRWRSAEPPGWSEVRQGRFRARDGNIVSFSGFFNGLDREGLMLAPAAGSGVAVAALQVPFTRDANNDFNTNIHITTVIPDRRLYAFDLETGRPLWDHCPPPTWDCESGAFTQRMRVAGPPVIAGRRVLVPMWRPQGRISYYVACYDLSSGAYQWSTQIASGQRSLNMFGRTDREFCAPPLVVVGERVIALTQLGTIAALDLFSGEMIWQTVYDQIPVPGADGSQAVARTARWRNAPPAVERGVVVVTPIDSEYMMGIDLADGAVLWSLDAAQLGEPSGRSGAWCLLGVRDDTVYVGGRIVMALRAKQGIAKAPSQVQARSENVFGDGFPDPTRMPRAVLTARHVIAPTSEGSVVLDRANLEIQETLSSGMSSKSWGGVTKNGGGWGNLAIGNGTMFALSPQLLWGILDWRSIEARLENDFARHPDDSGLATRFGDFLRERAASELKAAKPQAAELHVQRAEKILQGPANAGISEARLALFSTLRLKAKVLVAYVQASQSLEPLERAALLAPDPEHLSLVLAEIARRSRIEDPSRFEPTLAELERRCGDLEFPVEEDEPSNEARSVLRWVIEQRIADAASRGNHSKEFAALIDLLARCGDGPLSPAIAEPPGEKGETPAMRIEQRLAAGARAAWQPFEEKARVAFESARASGDALELERVARLFPHTAAARDSRDARLRLAIEAGDSAASVRAAFEELPADWSAQNTTPRQARLVWLAAQALRSDGNPRYASALLSRLAKFQPEVSADEQAPEVTFAALASLAEAAASAPVDPARSAHFDTPEAEIVNEGTDSVLLGELDLGAKSVFVIAGRDRFSAFGADGTRLWTQAVEGTISPGAWQKNALLIPASPAASPGTFAGGRVVLTWRGGIQALDGATGEELWTWEVRGNLLDSPLSYDGGVLTVSAMQPGTSALLFGIDIGRGTQLWEHACPPGLWAQPVVGSGLAVLLPKQPQFHKADVIELATGSLIRSVEIGQLVPSEDRRAAWIENARLILPHFTAAHATQDALVAFDLDTGQRAWRVPSDNLRDLDAIARCEDDTYLVYRVNGKGSGAGNLKELDTRIGAVREVPGVAIGPSDLPIGLRQNGVTRLGAPYLFLRSSVEGGNETRVRSIHLPYGQRWVCRLPIKQDDLYSGLLPLPAVSSHLVVFAYTQELAPGSGRAQSKTRLMLVERDSGTPRTNRDLPTEMGRSEALEMATLGNLLILCGKDRTMIWAGPDTKEQR